MERKSSILKPLRTRSPFLEVDLASGKGDEEENVNKTKKVRFSSNFVKPFTAEDDKTVWDVTIEEPINKTEESGASSNSECTISNTTSRTCSTMEIIAGNGEHVQVTHVDEMMEMTQNVGSVLVDRDNVNKGLKKNNATVQGFVSDENNFVNRLEQIECNKENYDRECGRADASKINVPEKTFCSNMLLSEENVNRTMYNDELSFTRPVSSAEIISNVSINKHLDVISKAMSKPVNDLENGRKSTFGPINMDMTMVDTQSKCNHTIYSDDMSFTKGVNPDDIKSNTNNVASGNLQVGLTVPDVARNKDNHSRTIYNDDMSFTKGVNPDNIKSNTNVASGNLQVGLTVSDVTRNKDNHSRTFYNDDMSFTNILCSKQTAKINKELSSARTVHNEELPAPLQNLENRRKTICSPINMDLTMVPNDTIYNDDISFTKVISTKEIITNPVNVQIGLETISDDQTIFNDDMSFTKIIRAEETEPVAKTRKGDNHTIYGDDISFTKIVNTNEIKTNSNETIYNDNMSFTKNLRAEEIENAKLIAHTEGASISLNILQNISVATCSRTTTTEIFDTKESNISCGRFKIAETKSESNYNETKCNEISLINFSENAAKMSFTSPKNNLQGSCNTAINDQLIDDISFPKDTSVNFATGSIMSEDTCRKENRNEDNLCYNETSSLMCEASCSPTSDQIKNDYPYTIYNDTSFVKAVSTDEKKSTAGLIISDDIRNKENCNDGRTLEHSEPMDFKEISICSINTLQENCNDKLITPINTDFKNETCKRQNTPTPTKMDISMDIEEMSDSIHQTESDFSDYTEPLGTVEEIGVKLCADHLKLSNKPEVTRRTVFDSILRETKQLKKSFRNKPIPEYSNLLKEQREKDSNSTETSIKRLRTLDTPEKLINTSDSVNCIIIQSSPNIVITKKKIKMDLISDNVSEDVLMQVSTTSNNETKSIDTLEVANIDSEKPTPIKENEGQTTTDDSHILIEESLTKPNICTSQNEEMQVQTPESSIHTNKLCVSGNKVSSPKPEASTYSESQPVTPKECSNKTMQSMDTIQYEIAEIFTKSVGKTVPCRSATPSSFMDDTQALINYDLSGKRRKIRDTFQLRDGALKKIQASVTSSNNISGIEALEADDILQLLDDTSCNIISVSDDNSEVSVPDSDEVLLCERLRGLMEEIFIPPPGSLSGVQDELKNLRISLEELTTQRQLWEQEQIEFEKTLRIKMKKKYERTFPEKIFSYAERCEEKIYSIISCTNSEVTVKVLHESISLQINVHEETGLVTNLVPNNLIQARSSPVAKYMNMAFLQKLSNEQLKHAIGETFTMFTLLDYLELTYSILDRLIVDLMHLKDSYLSSISEDCTKFIYRVRKLRPKLWIDVTINLMEWSNLNESSITHYVKFGSLEQSDLVKIVNDCPKDVSFLKSFIERLHTFIENM